MTALLWLVGFGLAGMIGGALGGSFVQEHGRKVLPAVVIATLVTGLLIGWGLTGEYDAMQGANQLH